MGSGAMLTEVIKATQLLAALRGYFGVDAASIVSAAMGQMAQ